tara:strand:- start:785 stop:2974 length:2190 start_codon:yes stop_codon:yes gene_type:complete
MSLKVVGNTGYSSNQKDLVAEITEKVPSYVQIESLKRAFPNGKVIRNEFYIGSLSGEAGQSLKIDIDPISPNFMRGMDFNTGEGIGGITKILMAAYDWKIKDVAEHFSTFLDKDRLEPPMNPINPNIPQQPPVTQPEQVKQRRVIDVNTPHDGEYLYLSEDGEILVTVRRYIERDSTGEIVRDTDGNAKKEFRQFPRLPETRPLYNLHHIAQSDRVIWVEGEKCADELTKKGYTATCTIGGAGMLSRNTKDKFDFSPLQGKEVIIWPDNDEAGLKLAKIVQELSQNAGAKLITMLVPPKGKPKKWDAADAIEEGFDISNFLNAPTHKVKKSLSLRNPNLLASAQFQGSAPEQKFLIGDTMPLGVPVVFAAAGDSGKGMMTLDLAMKVASGDGMQNAFGGMVSQHGTAIILSAEDDRDELHRRISRLDPLNKRSGYDHDLIVVPLPNEGGVFPIMMKVDNTYATSSEFEKIYEEMLEIEDLALVVVDPMASFVHADVNADPAAGAAFMGLLAQISTETGATVIVNHHMAKIRDKEPITTPEEARNLIRGTSAIVDGVRSAFAVWQVDASLAESRCTELDIKYTRNAVFDGAVVKSNGPANREIRHFIRNPDTGLLEDRTVDLRSSRQVMEKVKSREEYLFALIADRESRGIQMTMGGGTDGVPNAIITAANDDINAFNLKRWAKSTILGSVNKLMNEGRIGRYKTSRNTARKWLGVVGGRLHQEEQEFGY